MTITAAADGSALGNPGPAGWGWYIDDERWACGGWAHGTNNMGELSAVLDLLQQTEVGREIVCRPAPVFRRVRRRDCGRGEVRLDPVGIARDLEAAPVDRDIARLVLGRKAFQEVACLPGHHVPVDGIDGGEDGKRNGRQEDACARSRLPQRGLQPAVQGTS